MTLVNTPANSAVVDETPETSFDDFLEILAHLRLAPARVEFNADRRELTIRGARIALCAKERDLLTHLALNADRAVSREELFSTVWNGAGLGSDSRTVDAHIRRLRKKLAKAPGLISTVRGQGYRFNTGEGVRVQATLTHTLAA